MNGATILRQFATIFRPSGKGVGQTALRTVSSGRIAVPSDEEFVT
jgi:hypothetical protein